MSAMLERFVDLEPELGDFRQSILDGLSSTPKWTPAKFFYDAEGSALFERICDLPEYYPTRTECGILRDRAGDLRAMLPGNAVVVEFGSGSDEKMRLLLKGLRAPVGYVPIDISREHLLSNAERFAADNPGIAVAAICADFTRPLSLDGVAPAGPRIGFFPGSTIGNLTPGEARAFLGGAAGTLGRGGHLVIGVDLVKDRAVLEAAYDDAAGVTAAFNLNLLGRINRELDGDFDLSAFRHRAVWNAAESRIEMHLDSAKAQTVTVAGRTFAFGAGESIHTESSYKYTLDSFPELARSAGFEPLACFTDAGGLFSVHCLRVA